MIDGEGSRKVGGGTLIIQISKRVEGYQEFSHLFLFLHAPLPVRAAQTPIASDATIMSTNNT